jgi:hypothetical protein
MWQRIRRLFGAETTSAPTNGAASTVDLVEPIEPGVSVLSAAATDLPSKLTDRASDPAVVFELLRVFDPTPIRPGVFDHGTIEGAGLMWQVSQDASLITDDLFPPEVHVATWAEDHWELDETEDSLLLVDLELKDLGIDLDVMFGYDNPSIGSGDSTQAQSLLQPAPRPLTGAGVEDHIQAHQTIEGRWRGDRFVFTLFDTEEAIEEEIEGESVDEARDRLASRLAELEYLSRVVVDLPVEVDEAAQGIVHADHDGWDDGGEDDDLGDVDDWDPTACDRCGEKLNPDDEPYLDSMGRQLCVACEVIVMEGFS